MSLRSEISAVDLFCGAGGLTHGLERAGVKVNLGVDIDPACEHPFKTNNRGRFLRSDVNTLAPSTIAAAFVEGAVTMLAGCAPCQPFSTYSRASKKSKRESSLPPNDEWQLVKRFGDFVTELKPDLVTMENVPPLSYQPVFQTLLRQLSDYSVDFKIIDCPTIGLPQRRKRLVLVASRLGPISLPNFDAPQTSVRDAIGNLPSLMAGEVDPGDRLHRASRLSELNLRRIKASKPGGTWRDWPDALRAKCHVKDTGATYPSVYGRMNWDEPSPTITTQCFGYGNGRFGHPEQHRAITLREAAMLQGFPRNYEFVPADEPVSFAKLGRLIGNAVPVKLGEVIGILMRDHVKSAC